MIYIVMITALIFCADWIIKQVRQVKRRMKKNC